MTEQTKDDLMVGAASLVLTLVVAGGGAFTSFVVSLGCGVGENTSGDGFLCDGPWAVVPLAAAALALVAWVAMATMRSARIYWWGTGIATVLGGLPWLF